MPRAAVNDNKRMSLRVSPETRAKLVRAAALRNTDLTNFVMQTARREAEAVIEAPAGSRRRTVGCEADGTGHVARHRAIGLRLHREPTGRLWG